MDIELLLLSKPWSGEGGGTWVTEVAGLFISYYALSLGKVGKGFILHQNHSVLTGLQVEKS